MALVSIDLAEVDEAIVRLDVNLEVFVTVEDVAVTVVDDENLAAVVEYAFGTSMGLSLTPPRSGEAVSSGPLSVEFAPKRKFFRASEVDEYSFGVEVELSPPGDDVIARVSLADFDSGAEEEGKAAVGIRGADAGSSATGIGGGGFDGGKSRSCCCGVVASAGMGAAEANSVVTFTRGILPFWMEMEAMESIDLPPCEVLLWLAVSPALCTLASEPFPSLDALLAAPGAVGCRCWPPFFAA